MLYFVLSAGRGLQSEELALANGDVKCVPYIAHIFRIQLIKFLISDHMKNWLCCEQFGKKIFVEWARSILKARKDLEILENINALYVVYIEGVVGRLAREVASPAHQGKLDLDVFSKLLC
ncbi:hypothetical protein ZWY2020_054837 [Hordeum vulgare]|nr:hypothetical protein ZWY2020_054837 [Hordeum vulgare]